jgi:hypothetical protein
MQAHVPPRRATVSPGVTDDGTTTMINAIFGAWMKIFLDCRADAAGTSLIVHIAIPNFLLARCQTN